MARDLKTVSTEALRAEYEAKLAEIKSLKDATEPLRAELTDRDNKATLILNAVMAGQHGLLRATGTPEAVISAAEAKFQEMRAAKRAARGEAVSS